ncbi:MAG: protein phosphatase 2C domain-containing protein [Planctomycetota bacterium]
MAVFLFGMQNGLVAQDSAPLTIKSLPFVPADQAPTESGESENFHPPLFPILRDFANPDGWRPWHAGRDPRYEELPFIEFPILVDPNKDVGDSVEVENQAPDPVATPPEEEDSKEAVGENTGGNLPSAYGETSTTEPLISNSISPRRNLETPRMETPVLSRRPAWDRPAITRSESHASPTGPFSFVVLLACFGGLMIAVYFYLEREAIKTQWAGAVGLIGRRTTTDSHDIPTRPRATPQPTSDTGLSLPQSSSVNTRAWRLGVDSIKGNVRSENQDSSAAFDLNGNQVLLIADGCGGVARGEEASRLAIEACATELFRKLVNREASAADAIAAGFAAAGDALANRGAELNMTNLGDGLRTTLIVVVGERSQFCFGYIGDGAIKVVRNTGDVEDLMVQHRVDASATNVLAASLGPTPHGAAEFGCSPRSVGDVLLSGTDGVFDRVDDRFVRELMRMAIYQRGDLMKTVNASLEQLSNIVDGNGGFVCDDNLTLGLMADGAQPEFQPRFWKLVRSHNHQHGTRR